LSDTIYGNYKWPFANLLCHVEVVGSIGVLGVVFAAMFPLGAAREAASRVIVPAGFVTAGVLVVKGTLEPATMEFADTLCEIKEKVDSS